jgi:hypothetical protein
VKVESQLNSLSALSAITPRAHRVSFQSEPERISKKNQEKRPSKTAPNVSTIDIAIESPLPSQPRVSYLVPAVEPLEEAGRTESKQLSLQGSVDNAKTTASAAPKDPSVDEETNRGQSGFLGGIMARLKRK